MVEGNLDIGGAVVFWSLADGTDRWQLRSGFAPLGLESFVPDPRPASAVLKEALEEVLGGPRVLVRPLAARDGFAVVTEDRGRAGNSYHTGLVARVSAGDPPELSFDPVDERAARVIGKYREHEGKVPAAQLSAALVKVVESLGGTRLRPTGAVYWVPGHKLDEWAAVAHAVERAATGRPSAVYVIKHKLDADAVRAVRDAVVGEVRADADRIVAEVSGGDLGGRALDTRRKEAAALRDKVLLYEDLLNVGLAGLHRAIDAADQAAATAALLLATEPTDLATAAAG
jgi:hypothetical protein